MKKIIFLFAALACLASSAQAGVEAVVKLGIAPNGHSSNGALYPSSKDQPQYVSVALKSGGVVLFSLNQTGYKIAIDGKGKETAASLIKNTTLGPMRLGVLDLSPLKFDNNGMINENLWLAQPDPDLKTELTTELGSSIRCLMVEKQSFFYSVPKPYHRVLIGRLTLSNSSQLLILLTKKELSYTSYEDCKQDKDRAY